MDARMSVGDDPDYGELGDIPNFQSVDIDQALDEEMGRQVLDPRFTQ